MSPLPPALHTPLVDMLGCHYPILLAGMGGVARHELAAAVSNAGGFGCMGMVREPVSRIREEITAYRRLSTRPFAINLIPAATEAHLLHAQIAVCLELEVRCMVLFWDVDATVIRQLKDQGVMVIHQVGTLAAARQALAAGADILMAQGHEAGGHVHGHSSLFGLLPEVVAISPVPVVAAGGIGSGQALVAALALGAQGVSCGSAFLATQESYAHPLHKQRLLAASADDTVCSQKFFRNWHYPAPVRVLENAVTRGDYDALHARRETPVIASQDGGPVYLFSTDSPLRDGEGRLDDMPLYAGQSCGQFSTLTSAAERLQTLLAQASDCLQRLQAHTMTNTPAPSTTSPAATNRTLSPMLLAGLQELMAAERAGARLAAMNLATATTAAHREALQKLHRDEAESCRRLRACLHYAGRRDDHHIGDFYAKVMALDDMAARLALIARGQHWVAKRLQLLLADCDDAYIHAQLTAVLALHTT